MVVTRPEESIKKLAKTYFQDNPFTLDLLKGDGSDRMIFLVSQDGNPALKAVGIHHHNIQENFDFIYITKKMKEAGLPVPEIYLVGEDQDSYLLQYLGEVNLAQCIDNWLEISEPQKIVEAYQTVLGYLVKIQDKLTPLMSAFLNKRLMERKDFANDLAYFEEDFIRRFNFNSLFQNAVKDELDENLLKPIGRLQPTVFVYRDFQSRNFMWWKGGPWFIDYQSAYLGTRYYDLASMLYASKSGLDDKTRKILIRHFYDLIDTKLDFGKFRREFYLFVLIRRLRSLGTYGFLGKKKKKVDFLNKISPGLNELDWLLKEKEELSIFKHTRRMISLIREQWVPFAEAES